MFIQAFTGFNYISTKKVRKYYEVHPPIFFLYDSLKLLNGESEVKSSSHVKDSLFNTFKRIIILARTTTTS